MVRRKRENAAGRKDQCKELAGTVKQLEEKCWQHDDERAVFGIRVTEETPGNHKLLGCSLLFFWGVIESCACHSRPGLLSPI